MAVPQLSVATSSTTPTPVKQQFSPSTMSTNHYGSPHHDHLEESHPLLQKLDSVPAIRQARLWSKAHLQHLRPWSDFMDRHRISKPASLQEAVNRINHNVLQFKVNYAVVALGLVVYIMYLDG